MKKFCFFILTLGFFFEGKAQFISSSSSEVYYYTPAAGENNPVYLLRFSGNNKCIFESTSIYPNSDTYGLENTKMRLAEAEKEIWNSNFLYLYDSSVSTSKYYTYLWHQQSAVKSYISISKDKESVIMWQVYPTGEQFKYYYKRISRNDILNLGKPNIDFLE